MDGDILREVSLHEGDAQVLRDILLREVAHRDYQLEWNDLDGETVEAIYTLRERTKRLLTVLFGE